MVTTVAEGIHETVAVVLSFATMRTSLPSLKARSISPSLSRSAATTAVTPSLTVRMDTAS